MNVEKMTYEGIVYAIVIRRGDVPPGVHFFTSNENHLQAGWQMRVKGTVIKPHAHCKVKREGQSYLQEVLHIQQGKLKILFYTDDGLRIADRILEAGDTILLICGGHGFEVLEDVSMLEVKMGPYDPASKKNIQEKM